MALTLPLIGTTITNRCRLFVTILTGKVSHCFCLWLSFGKQQQNKAESYVLTWGKWRRSHKCPSLFFERNTYTAYYIAYNGVYQLRSYPVRNSHFVLVVIILLL